MTTYYYETGAGFRITRRDVERMREAVADEELRRLCDRALADAPFGCPDAAEAWRLCAAGLQALRAC